MNSNQQFCLRWNNHQSTLISVFETLLESGTLVDCTLAAEGQYLKAHKVVLSACSPYLGMLLSQDFEKHPILILKDVKFQELKSMLDYMYRGEVNISQDQLGTFLKAAESLQIKGLTDSSGSNGNGLGSGAGGVGGCNSDEDFNARHRKHLAIMAAVAARGHSPIIEQHGHHNQHHQHQRWMNNGGSGNTSGGNGGGGGIDMMREGSVSPSPRKRKRLRRPSLGQQTPPVQNGHDELPMQPSLIHQQQILSNNNNTNNNNVLAQSLAAPPLATNAAAHPPKQVTSPPPRAQTPAGATGGRATPTSTRDETSSPITTPSSTPICLKPELIEHNNNVNNAAVPFKQHNNNSQDSSPPTPKSTQNHSTPSNEGGAAVQSDEEAMSETDERHLKKEDVEEEQQTPEDGMDDDIEEEMDEDSSNGPRSGLQGGAMANAPWMMADASMPGSDCLQDSKENEFSKLWKGHYLQSWDAWSAHYPSVPSLLQRAVLSNSPPSPSGDKGVECPNCGRHYKLKSSLRNHQKWECGKEPQFQCPYCNYRAKQKMHVARHIERMHREKLGILENTAASPIASILPTGNQQQQQTSIL